MSVFKVTYAKIEAAYAAADRAVEASSSYADLLQKKVCDPLDELTKGSSSYTKSACGDAEDKIAQLQERIGYYEDYSALLQDFLDGEDGARAVDAAVAAYIESQALSFCESMGFDMEEVAVTTELVTIILVKSNESIFSRIDADMKTALSNMVSSAMDDAWHWYKCGGGQYVVNTVTYGILLVIAVVLLVEVAVPALFAVGTVFAGVVAVASLILAVIAVLDYATACMCDSAATVVNNEDPGWASYYNSINSFSTGLSRMYIGNTFWDRLSNQAAFAVDVVTIICTVICIIDFIRSAYSLWKTTAFRLQITELVSRKYDAEFVAELCNISATISANTTYETLKSSVNVPSYISKLQKVSFAVKTVQTFNDNGWRAALESVLQKYTFGRFALYGWSKTVYGKWQTLTE